jgi:cytochrome c peroxidase
MLIPNQTKIKKILSSLLFLLLSNLLVNQYNDTQEPRILPLGNGSTQSLNHAFQNWKNKYSAQQGEQFLTLALRPNGKIARLPTSSNGKIKLDLYTGELTATIKNLPEGPYYLWLNANNQNTSSEVNTLLGTFEKIGKTHQLVALLDKAKMRESKLTKFIVSTSAKTLTSPPLLVASPNLFQKLFYHNKYWTIAQLDTSYKDTQAQEKSFAEYFLPRAAYAHTGQESLQEIFAAQIAKGRDLFINETFNGNGRTCSTCHRLDNNHTIDPKYITKLPDSDPLFVSETNPDLTELERPKLLRQFGLFLVNIDGFDKPAVLRSSSHLLALGTSTTPEWDAEGTVVESSLGWSADGSPLDGSLRSFTIGAIIQHMPKTLNREVDIDFRMPTDDELDALHAYMLSLGRSRDPDLDNMHFSSPIVETGKELFHSTEPGTGQCKGCHFNAGANSSTSLQNGNRNTGVENLPNILKLVWQEAPSDGGFNNKEQDNCGSDNTQNCFGNHEFNMTTVVEAADTAPYFHNNSVNTLEEAIAFYNSKAFHASPGAKPADPTDPNSECGRCIHLEPTQVTAIALFLRTLNAMENIRSSNELDIQVTQLNKTSDQLDILKLAMAETEDAIEVLEGGAIIANPKSLRLLHKALSLEQQALIAQNKLQALDFIEQAVLAKNMANSLLLKDPIE